MSQLFDTPRINRERCGVKQVAVLVVSTVFMLVLGLAMRGQSAQVPAPAPAPPSQVAAQQSPPESPWLIIGKSPHEEAVDKLPALNKAGEVVSPVSDYDYSSARGFLEKQQEVVSQSYMSLSLFGCRKDGHHSLGITVKHLATDWSVIGIVKGSPAENAGIRVDDIIESVDSKTRSHGRTINDVVDTAMDEHVIVVRVQAAKKIAGSDSASKAPESHLAKEQVVAHFKAVTLHGCLENGLGLTVVNINRCIKEVTPKGPADIAGLREGDCIVTVDGKMPGPHEKIKSVIDNNDEHVVVVQEGDVRDTLMRDVELFAVAVPAGRHAGEQFQASLAGLLVMITVPTGAGPGSMLHVQLEREPAMQTKATQKDAARTSAEVEATGALSSFVQYIELIQNAEEDGGKTEDYESQVANADKILAEELCKIWPRTCSDQGLTRSIAFKDAKKKVKAWATLRAQTRAKIQAKEAGKSGKVNPVKAKLQESVIYKMAAKKIKASFGEESASKIRKTQDAQRAAYTAFEKLIQWTQGRAAALADDAVHPSGAVAHA